jgi:tetratricopeptide (TPR) repeat protein
MVAADLGRKPLESEVSRWFFARGLEFWRSEPLAALRLLAKKLRYLLNRQEWANNKCLYTVLREFTPTTGWLPVGFWIVGPLGLLGLALSLREARLFPLWAFAATYGLAISAFFVTARFRLPLLAPLILLGTYAVQWLGERLRARRFGSLAAALAALALLATFVNWIPQRGPFAAPIRNPAETLGSLGNRLADLGRVDEALHWLGRASEEARAELAAGGLSAGRKANLSVIHYSTIFRSALVLEGAGRLAEALAAYRRIVPLVPPAARPDLHQRMARIHDAQGEPAKAEEQRAKAAAARRALGP